MKKLIIIILAALLLVLSLTACQNRRGALKEHMSDQTEQIPVDTPVQVYKNMNQEQLEADYQSDRVLYAPTVLDGIVDIPCYYIFKSSSQPGGLAYSKLTNTFTTLCRDPFCKHEDTWSCIFSEEGANYISEIQVYGDRVYFLVERLVGHNHVGYLYSTDYLLNNLKQEYEFPVMVESQYEAIENDHGIQYEYSHNSFMCNVIFYGELVFYNDFTLDQNETIIPTIYTVDISKGEDAQPTVWKENLYAQSCKLYGDVLGWQNEDNEWVYYDLATNKYLPDYTRPDYNVTLADGYKRGIQLVCEEYAYVTIQHTTTMFQNDPHFKYYTTAYEMSGARPLFQRQGGDIYRVKTDGSDGSIPELIASLTTDGKPDLIWGFYTDGKTLIVEYETYKDFQNEYNQELNLDNPTDQMFVEMGAYVSPPAKKYAIIDLTTGEVHKPQENS